MVRLGSGVGAHTGQELWSLNLGDDKLELSTVGALGNLKFGPRLGRVRPYVGVGLGLGIVEVSASNPDLWFPESLESELSLLAQVMAGLDVRVTRRSYLGIEYRQLATSRTIDARSQRDRPLHRADDFHNRDVLGRAVQDVAASGTPMRTDNTVTRQHLHELGDRR